MLNQMQIMNLFKESGGLLTGHFKLSSGLHSAQYLQCALVLQHPGRASLVCSELASRFKDKKIDVVIGPALGGIIVSYEVARALGARSIFCERKEGKMSLRRGFSIKKGERVLIVEDVITTGGSVKEIIQIVRESGNELIGIGALINRSVEKKDFGIDYEALASLNIKAFSPAQCPLCKEGIPLEKPGSKPH